MSSNAANVSEPPLKRSLKLWNLIIYGIIIIQPTAPMGIYGVVSNVARGHVVSAILLGMAAMVFTAISYGRMARVYPTAGSAYTYVEREVNPIAGFLVGWSMLMDYLLNPIICAIWCSVAAANILPQIPYPAWAISFVVLFTALNLVGVQISGKVNTVLAIFMGIVVVVVLAYGIRYIALVVRPIGGQFLLPFYNPSTFQPSLFFRGTSISVLTYIGFDGISTMSEEVENPRRNILLATVLTCVIIGILSSIEVYVAQLAVPYNGPFPPAIIDTAYVHVASVIGGKLLFHVLNMTLLIANAGSGIAAQFGASRLLYGMGRANALPRSFFAHVDARTSIPRNNVLLIGACTLIGVFVLTYERGSELLNFGAFIAFIGVNLAALLHYRFRTSEKVPFAGAIPIAGMTICTFIWLNLGHSAQICGALWLTVGVGLYFFRRQLRTASAF
jgi:amino acid transporter